MQENQFDLFDAQKTAGWVNTFSGKRVVPLKPEHSSIVISDVAHSLSQICRWNGHTTRHFSVAQHSLGVERIIARKLIPTARFSRLYALLHDAPEYVLCDVARPVKSSLIGYKTIEDNLMTNMIERWNIPYNREIADCVKVADDLMLVYERKHLINANLSPWGFDHVNVDFMEGQFDDIMNMSMPRAKTEFISKFVELRIPNGR